MLSDDEMYNRMKNGWRGGMAGGTVCGQGSLRKNTANIIDWLPGLCEKLGITSVCDAGAGDLVWVKRVRWDVDYKAFDLIPRKHTVQKIDITDEALPYCDAILCRMVLNHLDTKRIDRAIDLFRQSAKYLIATHFVGEVKNRTREFTRLDLTEWLGEPIEMCNDGHESGCRLAVWKL